MQAGERLMVSTGRDALRMTDVGKLAGVAPSTLYEYFPSKEALLHALEEASWAGQVTELIGKLNDVHPFEFKDAVETMVGFAFDTIVARGQVHGMTAESEGSYASRQMLIENVVTAVAATIHENPRNPPVAPKDVELALHIVARLVPTMAWLGLRDFANRLPEWRSEVVRMCIGYMVKPEGSSTLAAAIPGLTPASLPEP